METRLKLAGELPASPWLRLYRTDADALAGVRKAIETAVDPWQDDPALLI